MDNQVLEIIKLSLSLLTPVLVVAFGLVINRTLEKSKSTLTKEKEWQGWWASKFLEVAENLTSAISECITTLHAVAQLSKETLPGWADELKEKERSIYQIIHRIQHFDWEIQNYVQFAPTSGIAVTASQRTLIQLVTNLIKNKQGDLEEIRRAQFAFNIQVRSAHAEILGISSLASGTKAK